MLKTKGGLMMNETLLHELNENIKMLNKLLQSFNKNVYTAKEAANYLNISYYTLLRLTRIGEIEHIKNGTVYLYTRECLDRWLERNKKVI